MEFCLFSFLETLKISENSKKKVFSTWCDDPIREVNASKGNSNTPGCLEKPKKKGQAGYLQKQLRKTNVKKLKHQLKHVMEVLH